MAQNSPGNLLGLEQFLEQRVGFFMRKTTARNTGFLFLKGRKRPIFLKSQSRKMNVSSWATTGTALWTAGRSVRSRLSGYSANLNTATGPSGLLEELSNAYDRAFNCILLAK